MYSIVRSAIVVCLFMLLALVLPKTSLAMTDNEIGGVLLNMKTQRSEEFVNAVIALAEQKPKGVLLHYYLWQRLAEAGPMKTTDNYAKKVLAAADSPSGMVFGALGYFCYSPEVWMRPYAENAIRESQPPTTRAIGFYLAALTGLTAAQPQNLAFAKSYSGDVAVYAYMALAEIQDPQTLYETLQAIADQTGLSTAISYAKFIKLSDADKKKRGVHWLKSGNNELQTLALRYLLSHKHADWLATWGVASIVTSAGQQDNVAYQQQWHASLATTLGYRIAVDNGQIVIVKLAR